MKNIIVVLLVSLFTGTVVAQEPPKPQKEHEWLQQLVGEWETETELATEPGKPPAKRKGTETVRAIGGFWVHCEIKGGVLGPAFTSILSLGYSPEKKKYVGTWYDSVASHLWQYTGSVDATGKILTLDTEGPGADGKPAKFREVLEIKDKDHKAYSSSMEQNGKWLTYLTIQYTRKK